MAFHTGSPGPIPHRALRQAAPEQLCTEEAQQSLMHPNNIDENLSPKRNVHIIPANDVHSQFDLLNPALHVKREGVSAPPRSFHLTTGKVNSLTFSENTRSRESVSTKLWTWSNPLSVPWCAGNCKRDVSATFGQKKKQG